MQAEGPPLLRHDGAGRATLTLNRARHLNRLHREDLLALQAHIDALAADTALRVVVLTGAGRFFCAGFNLQELQAPGAADGDPRLFERTVDALAALPVPTIARLNGSVFGGATDLALACDFRVGTEDMELRMPAARLGLHYYGSGMSRYVSRLGLQAAKRLFLLAETVDAQALLGMGYLDCLVPAAQLDAQVQALCDSLRQGAPLALRGMKQSLNDIAARALDNAVLEARIQHCAGSADLQEGLAAWAARRPARFRGS